MAGKKDQLPAETQPRAVVLLALPEYWPGITRRSRDVTATLDLDDERTLVFVAQGSRQSANRDGVNEALGGVISSQVRIAVHGGAVGGVAISTWRNERGCVACFHHEPKVDGKPNSVYLCAWDLARSLDDPHKRADAFDRLWQAICDPQAIPQRVLEGILADHLHYCSDMDLLTGAIHGLHSLPVRIDDQTMKIILGKLRDSRLPIEERQEHQRTCSEIWRASFPGALIDRVEDILGPDDGGERSARSIAAEFREKAEADNYRAIGELLGDLGKISEGTSSKLRELLGAEATGVEPSDAWGRDDVVRELHGAVHNATEVVDRIIALLRAAREDAVKSVSRTEEPQ